MPSLASSPIDSHLEWSIIIPAYNEESRLGQSLQTISTFMDERGSSWELIVVDDGSTDGTVPLVERDFPQARLLRNPGNRGKGYSVRSGMLAARGKWVLFSDADLSTPIDELDGFEKHLRNGVDMAIASRALADSNVEVHQAWWRERSGRLFNTLVRFFSNLPYRDTQCGFKAYQHAAARRIAQLQRLEGWAFDVEQLRLAKMLDLRVEEIPVRWINSAASRLHFFRDAPRMLIDILKARAMRYDLGAEKEKEEVVES